MEERGVRPKTDPWAHRRGEPRTFAFGWTLFLLAAVLGSTIGLSDTAAMGGYARSARMTLIPVIIGVVALWPAVRFSQVPPRRRPVRSAAVDLVIVGVPVQLVLWPIALLTAWPIDVSLATSLLLLVWSVLIGGVVANRFVTGQKRPPSTLGAILATCVCIVVLMGAPVVGLFKELRGEEVSDIVRHASPLTGLYEVTGHAPTGASASVGEFSWRALAGVGAVGIVIWVIAIVRSCLYNPPRLSARMSDAADPIRGEPDEWKERRMEMITAEEKVQLEQRLDELLDNRPKISKRIAEARELGDLKENAEYHAAREEQGLQEAEIQRLEERLAKASVVDTEAHKEVGVVFLGATVKIREEGTDEEELVKLVGETSNNLTDDVFEATLQSPMGEALMKARVGETVAVKGPRGVTRFEILEIV